MNASRKLPSDEVSYPHNTAGNCVTVEEFGVFIDGIPINIDTVFKPYLRLWKLILVANAIFIRTWNLMEVITVLYMFAIQQQFTFDKITLTSWSSHNTFIYTYD